MEDESLIKIYLKEEELDVIKKLVQTGEISWHKEVLSEEKSFTVPVKREEMVIEKKSVCAGNPGQSIPSEIIRIPIREERVEINKYTFDLEKIEIFKEQKHHVESIETTLKKEAMFLNTTGSPVLKIEDH